MAKAGEQPSLLASQSADLWERAEPHSRGGSAWVFRVRSSGLALKVARTQELDAVLLREARELTLLGSPSAPRVLQADRAPATCPHVEARGRVFTAWRWVDGTPADADEPDLPARIFRALCVARDVGASLSHMHRAGLAHGDVKPDNVLYGDAHATLIDFGLMSDSWQLSPNGATPRFLPPAGPGESAQTRDLWALGLTIAEAAAPHSVSPTGKLHLQRVPEPARMLVQALVRATPASRLSAAWITRKASSLFAEQENGAPEGAADPAGEVRRAYFAARRSELQRVARGVPASIEVSGLPGTWLNECATLLKALHSLESAGSVPAEELRLGDLSSSRRSAWLLALVGSTAAAFPPTSGTDADLAQALVEACATREPHALRYLDFIREDAAPPDPPERDAVSLTRELARGHMTSAILRQAETTLAATPSTGLALALGVALRRLGDTASALEALGSVDAREARAEAAETLRRAGDADGCRAALEQISGTTPPDETDTRRAATEARLALDQGQFEKAASLLQRVPTTTQSSEVLTLCALARGDLARAEEHVATCQALAADSEEHARAWGLVGMVAHQRSDHPRGFDAYRRAADHAVRGGSLVEEATYLIGLAAASTNLGQLDLALASAQRATALFGHLGRPNSAARAWLSLASSYLLAGATQEAVTAAEEALARGRAAGDVRCQGYALTNMAAAQAAPSPAGLQYATDAARLLESGTQSDQLLCATLMLGHGGAVDVATHDALARGDGTSDDAALQWWTARGRRALDQDDVSVFGELLQQLAKGCSRTTTLHAHARALATATELASRRGDGELTRLYAQRTYESARTLRLHTPPELLPQLNAVDWIQNLRAPETSSLSFGQLLDVESLVRALGTRDRLAPLLNQVLDALILWTGVERGLLLMKAPNGRLMPRAARNIAREDVSGEQLKLSTSLAQRALQLGEPVVAVDATNELPEVHESVHLLKLRSVLAVPLVCRGEALGVVYLDDRARAGAFGQSELAWVRVVATLAAVAIADARDQLLLRRAVRRARRAEQSLAATLAARDAELRQARRALEKTHAPSGRYRGIVAQSSAMLKTLTLVDQVSQAEVPVLILGESGSGKELIARAIHANSPRATHNFVAENCSAIPEPLLEATLFGHTRGAFTGAARPRAGLFEIASGGTLFLDEVGEMPEAMQTKLLRTLESGEVRPLGSERTRAVDVRLIAATHRNLKELVAAGEFREDLYYRLHVISVELPPLRERVGDVPLLLQHFLKKHGNGRMPRVSRAAEKLLGAYHWPGNVRQLENEARRLLVTAGDLILPEHLSDEIKSPEVSGVALEHTLNVRRRVDALEAELVRDALERTNGNQTRAAELLGLSRYGLQKMIKRLNLDVSGSRAGHTVN